MGGPFFDNKATQKADILHIDPFIDRTPELKKPKKPVEITPEQAAKAAQLAADKKKKQAIGAYGTSDTILTGPSGLAGSTGKPKLGG